MKTSVTFQSYTEAWLRVQRQNLESALDAMADAIMTNSSITAPMKTGAMRNSRHIERQSASRSVVYGGGSVDYAIYQENGKQSWHFTTAGTGPHFLKTAGDAVSKAGIGTYLQ